MINLDKYAVIQTGGKQYLVSEDQELDIEKIDKKKGAKITFKDVLLVKGSLPRQKKGNIKIGTPFVKGAKVEAKIIDQFKDKKIRVAKFKAKSRYRRVKGHRQQLTKIKISKISF
jgi:large subunit ribosomal protein L21